MGVVGDRVAIVTGAGRGIGRAEALGLAAEGAAIVAADVNPSAIAVAEEICGSGGRAIGVIGDVTSFADAQRIADVALSEFGALDILVNNAGILRDRMFYNMTEADWDEVLNVNLRGHFTMSRCVVPVMREKRWGRIVNTASEAGLGTTGSTNYAASKEGVIGFTRSLARELERFCITVNAIRPRAVTPLAETVQPHMRKMIARIEAGAPDPYPPTWDAEVRQKFVDLPGLMRPEVVAAFVVLLCSDEASDLSGGDFIIGGDEIAVLPPHLEPRTRLFQKEGWCLESLGQVLPEIRAATGRP